MHSLVVNVVCDLDKVSRIASSDIHGVELLGDVVLGVLNEVRVVIKKIYLMLVYTLVEMVKCDAGCLP